MISPINGFRLKNVGKAPSSDHWKEGTREDSGRNPGFPANIPCPAMTKDGMEEKMPQDTRRNPFGPGPLLQ